MALRPAPAAWSVGLTARRVTNMVRFVKEICQTQFLSIFGDGRKWGGGSPAGRDGGVSTLALEPPPSAAKAIATSPFAAFAENGEDLTWVHPAANPDDNAIGKITNDGLTGAGA